MTKLGITLFISTIATCYAINGNAQIKKQGRVITEKLVSTILKENRIGINVNRTIKIYLPPDYASSGKAYPVVYYFHSMFYSAEKLFSDNPIASVFDRAIQNQVVGEFIFVAADFSSPTIGSLYENSPTSGRWLDFIVNELVPFVDTKFRTLPHRDSRALAGDFMGGRGALKLAMTHAEMFSVVYALHPVATGMGHRPWLDLQMNWKNIYSAKIFDEVDSKIFVAVSQAFLPNANRPPFYCDFFRDEANGEFKVNVDNINKAKAGFHLEETLIESSANLRSMRGIAFDWARFDPNADHVYANQAFSKKLRDLDVVHEGEEYNGDPGSQNWTEYGRVYSRLLPFMARHLVFEAVK
ncbi:MAG: alpha/beta hydrolase-fold protein [Chryseolinea sp.]